MALSGHCSLSRPYGEESIPYPCLEWKPGRPVRSLHQMSYLGSIPRPFKYVNPEDGNKCFRNSVYLFQRHILLSIEVELVARIEDFG